MTREIIALALESEGLKAGTNGFTIPEEREATCWVTSPGDVLTVNRIVTLDARDKYLLMKTAKDEHYYFAYEDVLGVRILGKAKEKERSAGFSR
jgi:hypothetical protein